MIAIVLVVSTEPCGIQHMQITSDLKSYESTLDPEFCDALLERIYEFNDACNSHIQIIDCG